MSAIRSALRRLWQSAIDDRDALISYFQGTLVGLVVGMIVSHIDPPSAGEMWFTAIASAVMFAGLAFLLGWLNAAASDKPRIQVLVDGKPATPASLIATFADTKDLETAHDALETIKQLITVAQRHNREVPWSRILGIIALTEDERSGR